MYQSNEYGIQFDERRATFHVEVELPLEIILICDRLYELVDQLAADFALVFHCYRTEIYFNVITSGMLIS